MILHAEREGSVQVADRPLSGFHALCKVGVEYDDQDWSLSEGFEHILGIGPIAKLHKYIEDYTIKQLVEDFSELRLNNIYWDVVEHYNFDDDDSQLGDLPKHIVDKLQFRPNGKSRLFSILSVGQLI